MKVKFGLSLEEIYREARIARGWSFRAAGPALFSLQIVEGLQREDAVRALAAICHAQAVLDARHALN